MEAEDSGSEGAQVAADLNEEVRALSETAAAETAQKSQQEQHSLPVKFVQASSCEVALGDIFANLFPEQEQLFPEQEQQPASSSDRKVMWQQCWDSVGITASGEGFWSGKGGYMLARGSARFRAGRSQ